MNNEVDFSRVATFYEELKAKHGLETDRALAGFLGVSPAQISMSRRSSSRFGPRLIAKIAKATSLTASQVMARVQCD